MGALLGRVGEKLTFANVMAAIAVFVALGGIAWAATAPKDSVVSKSIKDGQVKPKDLGTPATFTSAGLPDVGGACGPGNGDVWGDLSPNVNNSVGYYRDPSGMVHLQGIAIKCNAAGNTILTLPAGYRPPLQQVMVAIFSTGAGGRVNVDQAGTISPDSVVPAQTWLSLDGLSFRCGPSGANGCP